MWLIQISLFKKWFTTWNRESLIRGGLKLETSNTQTATLILRAEPTVASILKTLDTDYAKNQVRNSIYRVEKIK